MRGRITSGRGCASSALGPAKLGVMDPWIAWTWPRPYTHLSCYFVSEYSLSLYMPPNKEPSSEANLRKIARNHGIRLEGPVPAADWPNQYKHTFEVIREIQFMQYEHYKEDAQIPLSRRKESQKRVRHMRRTVQGLLDDLSPNEDSFRELERSLLGRFFKPPLWYVGS
jgi:hypothetical protein